MSTLAVPGIPFPLESEGPVSGRAPVVLADGVELSAGPQADLFLNPRGSDSPPDAERFLGPVSGDFRLSAHVTVDFRDFGDAGVLLGYVDASTWFKLCAERDHNGIPRVVSVITRDGASDDANSWPIADSSVYLRIARSGRAFAMHASSDGSSWHLVRHFALPIAADQPIKVGILAQSPAGDGTAAIFTEAQFDTVGFGDVRDGS